VVLIAVVRVLRHEGKQNHDNCMQHMTPRETTQKALPRMDLITRSIYVIRIWSNIRNGVPFLSFFFFFFCFAPMPYRLRGKTRNRGTFWIIHENNARMEWEWFPRGPTNGSNSISVELVDGLGETELEFEMWWRWSTRWEPDNFCYFLFIIRMKPRNNVVRRGNKCGILWPY
jgi:hypothetical protein